MVRIVLNHATPYLPYQGRQFSKQEFENIQESLHREFGMWNCRHTIFPIILGLSQPLYTEEERQQIIAQSTEVKEFEGKTYTAYEATQLQRRIETEIRKRKDRAILAKEAGDDISRKVEQLKINQLQNKYLELSRAFKLPLAKDRMTVSGFRPVMDLHQFSEKKLVGLVTKNNIEIKEVSNHFTEQLISRGISFEDVVNSIANPINIEKIRIDDMGISQRIIGIHATININPETGKLITVWKTGKRDLRKYGK